MPKFKKNPNPIMKKGPFKMKYKPNSAFPFKSSPAKLGMAGVAAMAGGMKTPGAVPPHTHDGGGEATESAATSMASVAGQVGTSGGGGGFNPFAGGTFAGGVFRPGRRTTEGQL